CGRRRRATAAGLRRSLEGRVRVFERRQECRACSPLYVASRRVRRFHVCAARETARKSLYNICVMRLRELHVGCFGGGTGLPSLLGGLKTNPWLRPDAVVTMFDSGGSSGVLRDELGVLPPGDILKCALALARNSREARRVLL